MRRASLTFTFGAALTLLGSTDAIAMGFGRTTTATTLTGFGFPFHGLTPAIGVGIVSTLVLALAIAALYLFHLAGSWRWVYVVGCVIAQYLNCFVLVVQAFLKVPALHALAPTQSEPAFKLAQGFVLLAFIAIGVLAVRRFHPTEHARTLRAAG